MESKLRVLIGLIIIFLIFTLLSISIYYKGRDLDCNNCEITFSTMEQGGRRLDSPLFINILALDLHNSFINGECPIKWDRVQGYYEN